jgi:hypothetical protein
MAPNFLSIIWCGEAFHGLGVQDVKSLIQVGALFPLDGGRRIKGKKKEKKKKRSPWGRKVFLGLHLPCWSAVGHSCYVQLMTDLWVSL